MNHIFKRLLGTILLFVVFQSAKPQTAFIDSIRAMLVDLDTSIQHPPINALLKHTIGYCSGNVFSDSLSAGMEKLISEDYLLEGSLRQPVSPHLLKKYLPFMLRICMYMANVVTPYEQQENRMRQAVVMLHLSADENRKVFLARTRLALSQNKPEDSFQLAKWSYYYSQTCNEGYYPDSAGIYIKKSLSVNPNHSYAEKTFYAKVLFRLGTFLYERGKRDAAFTTFQQHLALRESLHGPQSAEYAFWLIVTADQYTYLAKYKVAQALNFQAQEITRKTAGEFSGQYALCLNDIAEVYYRTGEYFKALPYATQSLAIKRKLFGNEYFDNVVSLHNLATLYTRMGLYEEAIPLLEESLNISRKYFGERLVYAFDLHPLAEVYTYMGDYDKALPLYLKSRRIQKQLQLEEGGDEKNVYYPGVLHSLATLYTTLGQYNKAIDLYEHSLALKKEVFTELNPEYIKTLNSCAEAYVLKGYLSKALSLQLKSIALTRKLFGSAHPALATGLVNLASLFVELKDLNKAIEYASQALAMQRKIFGQSHPDIASTLDVIANIKLKQHHDAAALDYYLAAFSIRKKIASASHPSYIKSLYSIGGMYVRLGKFQQAVSMFIEADSSMLVHIQQSYVTLSEEEKLTYLKNLQSNFYFLPSLLYKGKTNDPAIANRVYNNVLILKSMLLFQQQQMHNVLRTNTDPVMASLYGQWRLNKSYLGQQHLLSPAGRAADFDSIKEATNEAEETLSRASSSFVASNLKYGTDVGQIRSALTTGEAAIEFVRFSVSGPPDNDFVYAALVVMPGTGNASFIPLASEKQIKDVLRLPDNTGAAAIDYLYPPAGIETPVSKRLFRLIWMPILSYLENVHTVYYVPAGLLWKLSFIAMHDGNGGYLSDRFQLRQLLSTRTLVLKKRDSTALQNGVVWGDIDYGKPYSSSWMPLPGTKAELTGISSIMNRSQISCQQITGDTATETRFKLMDGNSPAFIHIASHGFYLPAAKGNVKEENGNTMAAIASQQNPMFRSGILLAGCNAAWMGNHQQGSQEDGILTSYEISHLDLSKTSLVVLSACKTGLGDIEENEGVYGLQRAFKMAGVGQVLVSLWSVADRETAAFMHAFYQALAQTGNAVTALEKARRTMRSKYPPYYWAGFVLTE